MTVSIPVNKPWHEECLFVLALARGSVSRTELRSQIRLLQEQRVPSPMPPHTDGTYDYWISKLKKWRMVEESKGTLKLSGVGKWLAHSKLGHIETRLQLLYLVLCPKCIRKGESNCMVPQKDTLETNKSGTSFVDFECSACRHTQKRSNISPVASPIAEFLAFYRKAILELRSFVNVGGSSINVAPGVFNNI
jgi:hypothetical protein